MRALLTSITLIALSSPLSAQWLNYRTPGVPRTADGKPNLTAPAPRTANGRLDLTGLWTPAGRVGRPDPSTVLPWAQDLVRQRQDSFYRDKPSYRCLPSGPQPFDGWMLRILQTPTFIAVLNDDLTYRQIFMDGRTLERDPHPSWMGYSVGRWEGDTLVVESVGFNDKTWLHVSGLPHTEALRVRERIQRRDFGHLQIDVTFTDPGAYTKPWSITVNMELAADTEMLENVCEGSSDLWPPGRLSDAQQSKANVPQDVLASYVGVYSGVWDNGVSSEAPITVRVLLADGQLALAISGIPVTFPLVAQSETSFLSGHGYAYDFVRDGSGVVTAVVEHHAVGSYTYERQR